MRDRVKRCQRKLSHRFARSRSSQTPGQFPARTELVSSQQVAWRTEADRAGQGEGRDATRCPWYTSLYLFPGTLPGKATTGDGKQALRAKLHTKRRQRTASRLVGNSASASGRAASHRQCPAGAPGPGARRTLHPSVFPLGRWDPLHHSHCTAQRTGWSRPDFLGWPGKQPARGSEGRARELKAWLGRSPDQGVGAVVGGAQLGEGPC